jgi:hypothetical protein
MGSSGSPEAVRLVPGPLRANPRGYPRRLWAPPMRHCPAPLGVRSPILPYWLYFHSVRLIVRPFLCVVVVKARGAIFRKLGVDMAF